jgi:DNA-binding CsgD family transcriptional regulator
LVESQPRNADPTNEICGVGWLKSNEQGSLVPIALSGVRSSLDPREMIGVADNNILAESLRLLESRFFVMREVFENYRDSTHKDSLMPYASGIALPLNSTNIIGFALEIEYENLIAYKDYLELIRMIIALWISKSDFERKVTSGNTTQASDELTNRQIEIVGMIREGRTNVSIATILGYSESLIRQETISIYRKLGIHGRRELIESQNQSAEPGIN